MVVRRLVGRARVSALEMASTCSPRNTLKDRPLVGVVFGPSGREVVATADRVATIESDLAALLARKQELFAALVEYTAPDGSRERVSQILSG